MGGELARVRIQIDQEAPLAALSRSVFEILAAGGTARVAGQEAEHEDPDKEKHNGIN
jgi:hypothetical protein